jgi:CBS domain-containing protein
MNLESHAKNTVRALGQPYYDIHRWLDAFARDYIVETFYGSDVSFEHRKHRHHKEGVDEAVIDFRGKYSEDIIRKVCEIHIRDDYSGYLPVKKDFDEPDFLKKYHCE